jgi:hypothetical protein
MQSAAPSRIEQARGGRAGRSVRWRFGAERRCAAEQIGVGATVDDFTGHTGQRQPAALGVLLEQRGRLGDVDVTTRGQYYSSRSCDW